MGYDFRRTKSIRQHFSLRSLIFLCRNDQQSKFSKQKKSSKFRLSKVKLSWARMMKTLLALSSHFSVSNVVRVLLTFPVRKPQTTKRIVKSA